jgi:hypothetical protein
LLPWRASGTFRDERQFVVSSIEEDAMQLRRLPLLSALLFLLPVPAASQARIESIIPSEARIAVARLGADGGVRPEVGMLLEPGDMLTSSADSVFIELGCGEEGQTNTYMIASPFRVLIDVPTMASCHVNMLSGLTEVVAEAPTETTAGGVTLGSTGTQYAVEVRRDGDALVLNCIAYDGTVRVLARPDLMIAAGAKLVWYGERGVEQAPNTRQDLERSAVTYARFDLATAQKQNVAIQDPAAALLQLSALHYQVLANPADTARRVELAKEQIRYRVSDQAVYNLNRVDVRDEAALRRYEIDPAVVRGARLRPGRDPAELRVSGQVTRAAAVAAAAPTTDSDLRLIAAGRVDDAIANVEVRIRTGSANSRDHYALAKAYAAKSDAARTRSSAGRALVLHADDERLSAAELRELGELISRRD